MFYLVTALVIFSLTSESVALVCCTAPSIIPNNDTAISAVQMVGLQTWNVELVSSYDVDEISISYCGTKVSLTYSIFTKEFATSTDGNHTLVLGFADAPADEVESSEISKLQTQEQEYSAVSVLSPGITPYAAASSMYSAMSCGTGSTFHCRLGMQTLTWGLIYNTFLTAHVVGAEESERGPKVRLVYPAEGPEWTVACEKEQVIAFSASTIDDDQLCVPADPNQTRTPSASPSTTPTAMPTTPFPTQSPITSAPTFPAALAIQSVQWSGSSGHVARFTITYGAEIQVANTAYLKYFEVLKGSTVTREKTSYLESPVLSSKEVTFLTQSATGSSTANYVLPLTYVTGDKVYLDMSRLDFSADVYQQDSVLVGGAWVYIEAQQEFTASDFVGAGSSAESPYIVPTASEATLAKFTSVALSKESASNADPGFMDIKVVVTLSGSSARWPEDLYSVKIQLKSINGTGAHVAAHDLMLTPVASGRDSIYTWYIHNVAIHAPYSYGLYFEGVEASTDGARVHFWSARAVLTLPGYPEEVFGAIPAQKLKNNIGIKSTPLLISIQIKHWYIGSGGTNIGRIFVEYYGNVLMKPNSTIPYKGTSVGIFWNANNCDGGPSFQKTATLNTSITEATNVLKFDTEVHTTGHAIAVEDAAEGTVISNIVYDFPDATHYYPVKDPSYPAALPAINLSTSNHKVGSAGKCSDSNAAYVIH